MLLEKVETLKADLASYRQAKTAGDQAGAFKARAAQFSDLSLKLRQAIGAWQALEHGKVPVERPHPLPGPRKEVLALKEKFVADPASFETANTHFRHELAPAISKRTSQIADSAKQAWETFVDERADLPRREVLDTLATLVSYRQHVERILRQAENVAALRATVPSAETIDSVLAALDRARKEKDEAFAAMSGDALPPEVLKFLRAASQQGASLADYTDVVRIWLDERNLGAAFRIVSSRA